jgi:putative cell wall-binding protein
LNKIIGAANGSLKFTLLKLEAHGQARRDSDWKKKNVLGKLQSKSLDIKYLAFGLLQYNAEVQSSKNTHKRKFLTTLTKAQTDLLLSAFAKLSNLTKLLTNTSQVQAQAKKKFLNKFPTISKTLLQAAYQRLHHNNIALQRVVMG